MPPPPRCLYGRAMSPTPTYDQLRGERINADVPTSEADPHQVDHLGRHRLVDDALGAAVCGQPTGSGADLADWSGLGTVESGHPGKHRLLDDAPGAPAICSSSAGPPASHVGGWSWFTPANPDRAGLTKPTEPVPPIPGTNPCGQTHVADQQAGWGQRAALEQAPQAVLLPPAHPGNPHQHMAVHASRDARAGPPEAMTSPGTAGAPPHYRKSVAQSPTVPFRVTQRGSVGIATEEPTEK
jgi:hypothetical protein